jgi:hypothetical protein
MSHLLCMVVAIVRGQPINYDGYLPNPLLAARKIER